MLTIKTILYGDYGEWLSTNYYWISLEDDEIKSINDDNAFYDSDVTKDMVKKSIEKYRGFYVAKDCKENSNSSTFASIWEANKLFNNSQLFSSMIYKWQLDKIYDYFGKNTPIASSPRLKIEGKECLIRFWIAENDGNAKAKAAYWDIREYTIGSFNKEKEKVDNRQFVGLRVLYLK